MCITNKLLHTIAQEANMRFPGPYTIYRWYRYTEEENASYYQIKEKHEKIHAKSIFFGAVPVLVAATISSAFSAIITAIIGENDQSEVLFYFFYSLTVAQMIGYYVIYWLPTSIVSASPSGITYICICICVCCEVLVH